MTNFRTLFCDNINECLIYLLFFSEENSCAEEALDTWLEKVDPDNDSMKTTLSLLRKVVLKCLEWHSFHKSDFVCKVHKISLVSYLIYL